MPHLTLDTPTGPFTLTEQDGAITGAEWETGGADETALLLKAREYGRRFRAAANQAVVLIDTDGDGHANERRHLGLVRLARV